MIIDPAKLGISMVVAVVLLLGGVMALSQEEPRLVIEDILTPLASEQAVPAQAKGEAIVDSVEAGTKADPIEQKTSSKDDTMNVEVMTAELASFDPVTGGDWSLENLSDYNLEISQ